jgi:hypothetical protein
MKRLPVPPRSAARALRTLLALTLLATLCLAPAPARAQTTIITLESTKPSLVADGADTTTITATVTDGANPVVGETVSFVYSPTELATISPAGGITDGQGKVTTTVTAKNLDGRLVVQATAGSAVGLMSISLLPAGPVPDSVELVATPDVIAGDNAAATTFTATVTSAGAPVADYLVRFATFHPGAFSSATALTGADGKASVTFTSPVGGTAYIRAIADGGVAEATVELTITPVVAGVAVQAIPARAPANGSAPIAISATLTQAGGEPAEGVTVSFATTLGTLSSPTATTNAQGVATVQLTSATPGTATVTATAPGGAANTATAAFDATLLTFTSPASGAAVGSRRPAIQGSAAGLDATSVRVMLGGVEVCTAALQAGGAWSCTPAADLPEGSVTLQAELRDSGGVVIAPLASLTFTVDVTAPAAPTIGSPAEGATTGPRPTISGTAEPGATVTASAGGATLCTATAAPGGTWSCALAADLPAGANTITATAADAAGNSSDAATRSFIVSAGAVSAPTIATTLTNSRTPTITGTADAGALVRLTIALPGGGSLVYDNLVAGPGGAWSVNLATAAPTAGALPAGGLAPGSYALSAQARNGPGATSTVTAATLVVDITPPAAPAISSPATGGRTGAFPVLTGTAETDSTVVVTIDLDGDGATAGDQVTYEVAAGAQGAWTLNLATARPTSGAIAARGLPGGARPAVTARARDTAGNLSQPATLRFSVDFRSYLPLVGRSQ